MKKQVLTSIIIGTFCLSSSLVWANDDNDKHENYENHAKIYNGKDNPLNHHLDPKNIVNLPVHEKWLKKAHQDPRKRLKVHDISWRGKKWEYLVEYPREKNVVDPQHFEELLNTAGRHGWNLVSISHENHFYAFFFKRELHHHRVKRQLRHLKAHKQDRAIERAQKLKQIHNAHQARMQNLKEIQEVEGELEQADELLAEEVNTEKQILKEEKKLVEENKQKS